ncbi:hypothetical protein [Limosilactobacillus vaginalis]|uniref:hypothetical protein n=1 Tax=Limosilactobacillus vaginalis TaxID=1633 RepID=UPI0024B987C7|nr:hypothetical protein [Limosilactobacillus vaginalis]
MIDIEQISTYLESCLNSALSLNGESTLTNSFQIKFTDHYFDFIPYLPSTYALSGELAANIEMIATSALYPFFTVFPSNGPQYVRTGSNSFANARALRFFLKKGVYERLMFDRLSQVKPFMGNNGSWLFRLMRGYNYSPFKGSGMIGISGQSGSGKTILSLYLLQNFISLPDNLKADLTIVDPKLDANLFSFARSHSINYLTPGSDQNATSFLDEVSRALKRLVDEIHRRQRLLIKEPVKIFNPMIIYLDEALALTSSQTTKAKNAYLSLIDQVMLMGRATNCWLIISAQTWPSGDVVSSSAREQLGLRILLSSAPSKENCRFLFKNLEHPENIVLNRDYFDRGLGIVQGIDGRVVPFNAPFIKDLGS